MISKDELLRGRDKSFPDEFTQQISDNLDELLLILNKVRAAYGNPMKVTSGWRPSSINSMVKGAAPKSNHCTGNACDFLDTDGKLMEWCLTNLQLLTDLGIYLEDFRWTPNWVHMQNLPPKSRKRIFIPSESLAPAPKRWSGSYSSTFDK